MSSLANQQQNLTYPGLLQIPGGITSALQQVQDGNGNVTGLSISSTGASVTTSNTSQASKNGITYTGATARLISDMFGDLPTVKDFGAKGDGTTDDTAAFTAAIAASPTGVAVPAGSYKITGTVTGAFYSFGVITVVTGTVTAIQNLANIPAVFAASTGSTLVGTIQSVTGGVARTVAAKINESISVKDFGAKGDGVTDDTAALAAAQAYLVALNTAGTPLPALIFPAGIYLYSVSPNWAIPHVILQSEGVVRMRYTGTGNAFIIDGVGVGIYGARIGRFIIEAPSTAGHGVYIRQCFHSTFEFQVRGCGSASSGIYTAFLVTCLFINPEVSVNDGGWYLSAKPYNGIYMTNYAVVGDTGFTSFCTFINPIIEGTTQGIQLVNALGNTFIGGTSEGCSDTGIIVSATSLLNKFFTIDLEANLGDVLCSGFDNEFHGINSQKYFQIAAAGYNNLVVGGTFNDLVIASGAKDNTISAIKYNMQGTGSYSDSGTRTRSRDLYNVTTNLHHNTLPTQTTLAPSASPYTYTNSTGNDISVSIVGGVVSNIGIIRNAVSNGVGFVNGPIYLSANDGVVITYSTPPTLVFLNR